MLPLHWPRILLLGGATVLALASCGSDAGDGASGSMPSATSAPSTGSSPVPSNSGIVPESTWASVFKKAVPPLADKDDAEVTAAAKKVCTDFEASPTQATAKTILEGARASLGLDSTQAQIFASGAITHFCTPQADTWTKATLG